MTKQISIQRSIFTTVVASFIFLAVVLIAVQSVFESQRIHESTVNLVSEQVDLIVNRLDGHSIDNHAIYATKAVESLHKVSAVAVYDSYCNELGKKPLNIGFKWECDLKQIPSGFFIYLAKNSFSDSEGAVKYILLSIEEESVFTNSSVLWLIFITALLLGLTLIVLWKVMTERVLLPIESLRQLVSKKRFTKQDQKVAKEAHLPQELQPIFESVLSRDKIIQSNRDELVRKVKYEAVADNSQQVVHDLQTPLGVVRDGLLASGSSKVYKDALKDLETHISQIFEKSETYMKVVEALSLTRSVVKMKEKELEANKEKIKLKIESDLDMAKIKLNPTKFKFILLNLINNAKDSYSYMDEGEIMIEFLKKDHDIFISVKDNGCGIAEADLKSILKRGVSIGKEGSGLGLSDAKKYIEGLGGEVTVDSKPGEGTKVTMKIPEGDVGFMSNGKAPYDCVLIEDYGMTQMHWLDVAKAQNKSLAVFTSPHDFIKNKNLITKDAELYIDSHFPDFDRNGEDWAKDLSEEDYKNLWLTTSKKIDVSDMPWIKGKIVKHKPPFK